jgi:hypothetical protein
MDCRYCEIQVEITKRAYAARCPNPVAVLDYIREKMKGSTRPRVDIADMKRVSSPLAIEENMTPGPEKDLLTTAAEAIGTTLGQFAVKTGMVKPTPSPAKAASKKKTPAAKAAAGAKVKIASKKSPAKSTGPAKGKKAATKAKKQK